MAEPTMSRADSYAILGFAGSDVVPSAGERSFFVFSRCCKAKRKTRWTIDTSNVSSLMNADDLTKVNR